MSHQRKIAVIGLGAVGLPVAVAFGGKERVIGYDIHSQRINELKHGKDITGEFTAAQLMQSQIFFTTDKNHLKEADFFIISVPTPIDETLNPDLQFLQHATQTVAAVLKKGDIVVYESTIYPGATQEECIPLLEHHSQLKAGVDFTVGYSPERINPGDKEHTFHNITKIIAAMDLETLDIMSDVYGTILGENLYRAPNIKTAEAAKVLENIQRDLNIALMNECAIIFNQLGINTQEVIKAAKTKWNFLTFEPGLVGGHCISAAPHYLTYKANHLGHYPDLLYTARRVNEMMPKYVVEQIIKQMIHTGIAIKGAHIALLGMTFKENCADVRQSKVLEMINLLASYEIQVSVHDPMADKYEVQKEYDIELVDWEEIEQVDVLVLCVKHHAYREIFPEELANKLGENGLVVDLKGMLNPKDCEQLGIPLWQL